MVGTESLFKFLVELAVLFSRQRAGDASRSPGAIDAVDQRYGS